jgi:transposase
LEINYGTLSWRCAKYKKYWKSALRGWKNKWWRPKSKEKNLTNIQKKNLMIMLSSEPRKIKQLHLDFWLWTIKLIQFVIKKTFKKNLKFWKIREFLDEIEFTNQKPLFRAYQQNPEAVLEWVENTLPFIQDEAEKEWREIFYWDEAGFNSTDQKWKTWAKKWETPIVRVTWRRFRINAISCISSKWVLRFMVYEKSFNSETLIEFLKKIAYKTTQKMTLILDGHPTHKTKKVKSYLEKIDNQIKIYYLPWYSPELNPDEQVWNYVENDLKGHIIASKQHMIEKVKKNLFALQKKKDKVQSFFRHPEVKYF